MVNYEVSLVIVETAAAASSSDVGQLDVVMKEVPPASPIAVPVLLLTPGSRHGDATLAFGRACL